MRLSARSSARNPFGLGVAIGLIITLLISPALASDPAVDQMCAGTLGLDPELQQFVDTQCEVNTVVFGDSVEPSASYAVEGWNATTGTYTVFGAAGETAEFEAVYVLDADTAGGSPDLFALGVEVAFAAGVLSGPEGSIAVSGTVLTTGALTLDEEPLLLIHKILEGSELAVFASAARLESGIRVTNLDTLQTTSLAGAPIGDSTVLLGSPTDPSTVFGVGLDTGASGNAGVPGSIGTNAQAECIAQAYARWQIAVDAANATATACLLGVVAALAGCPATCGLAVLLGPISLLWALGCGGLCLGGFAALTAVCASTQSTALNAAQQNLELDLQACGVVIVPD